MPFLRYVARDKTGKLIEETSEVVSEEDLINSLQARGLLVISIGPAGVVKVKRKAERRYHRSVTINDLLLFARELATLLSSGVTLIKSLDILCKQIESKLLLRAIEQIKKDVEGGHTFQNALKKHDKIFSVFWINLIETGEASGHLPSSLEQLADYLEESANLRRKVISALIYPLILVIVATGAITIFLLKIIPVFADIFKGFNVELPILTRIIINLSDTVRKYFLIVLGGFTVLTIVLRKYCTTEIGRWQFDALKFKLPLIGPLMQEIAIERFTNGLATLIKSGVPILHALEISEKIAGNVVMEKAIREVKVGVRKGKGMAIMMGDTDLFSPMVVQMIGIGEEIGELAKMLERISAFYKERINTFITRLTSMFEPLVLVFMGIVVGIIVVSMFLPIFNISSAVKSSG